MLNELANHLPVSNETNIKTLLLENTIINGNAKTVLKKFPTESVALSFWSPPYHVGKKYEFEQSFAEWQDLLKTVLVEHARILKPGSFVAININDILCFKDSNMPQIQADLSDQKKIKITKEEILAAQKKYPYSTRYELAKLFGCSEQTIQRRLENNNVRGGKHASMTKVQLVGSFLQKWAEEFGMYLYDRRIWLKDPCWENSQWHSSSYRSVDEFEYVYVFWKPGITKVKRSRLSKEEWASWGSRGVWNIPSVRRNNRHEAEFPEALADRVIRLLSDPDDLVIDPFCGSGTTCVVAKRLGRRWCGIEISENYCKLARGRLHE